MKIVIPGGSGQVGTILARALRRDGHQVHSQEPEGSAGRLLQGGFMFNYPVWDAAARDLCQRSKARLIT